MEGNTAQRLARVGAYLATHPYMLPTYLKESINRSVSPISLELPWIAYSAISFLKTYLQPHHEIAEFGGGGSTLFFAKQAAAVHCIESSDLWANKLKEKIAEKNIQNVTIDPESVKPKTF